jgi:exosortase
LRDTIVNLSGKDPAYAAKDAEQPAFVQSGRDEQSDSGKAKRWVWPAVVIAGLWFILIDQLRLEWTVNTQYSYGWVMPILVAGLLLRRRTNDLPQSLAARAIGQSYTTAVQFVPFLFVLCAFLILPCRLVLEANPDWPTPKWLLAGSVIVLTLLIVLRSEGPTRMLHFAFPICFMLVAVPWPPVLENPVIQGLTRANVGTTVEVLSWLGIPAAQHGNTVEIAAGAVGVDEACSGIRSFHSSIMVALFLGEFFLLRSGWRLLLVPVGLLTAFGFNICRTTLLTGLAAHKGIAAIGKYHDRAGLTILLACTAVMWVIAWLFYHREKDQARRRSDSGWRSTAGGVQTGSVSVRSFLVPHFQSLRRLCLVLLVWLVIVELGCEAWYRAHEIRAGQGPDWALNWPPQEPEFREVPVSEVTRDMLSYSEGHCGAWISQQGAEWQMYYFRWAPGRTAAFAARTHTPGVCLAAAGKVLRPIADNRCPIAVNTLEFPFRRYEFEENGQPVYVFHCLWEENAPGAYVTAGNDGMLRLRLEAVLQGRRNLGQRSLELVVTGASDFPTARSAVQQQLQKFITLATAPSFRASPN